MDAFAVHAERASTEAMARLGDLIQYASGVGGAFVAMQARIFSGTGDVFHQLRGLQKTDESLDVWRLRVAKELVPQPSRDDRVKCQRILGDVVYRPMAKDSITDGRYWLIDLQKV